MSGQYIEIITDGIFLNKLHPTARPSRPIKVGDIFEVDSIGADGCAKFRSRYGRVLRDLSLDGKYWRLAAREENGSVAYRCECDIISLMTAGCKCGWIEKERSHE